MCPVLQKIEAFLRAGKSGRCEMGLELNHGQQLLGIEISGASPQKMIILWEYNVKGAQF